MSLIMLAHFVLKDQEKAKEAKKKRQEFTPRWPTLLALPFRLAPPAVMDEVDLWRDVAARLILDALGSTGFPEMEKKNGVRVINEEHVRTVEEAVDWFLYEIEDVETVFGLAGVDYKPIRDYIVQQEAKRNEKDKHHS